MGRNKKKKREFEEIRIYCFYCDRQFKDEEILIDHQRAKHFKCEVCNKKLSTAKGLATHCYQVHRVEVTAVPNSKEGNGSIELDIYGMAGVDEALVTLGRAPEEPDSKQAKTEETAPVAAAAVPVAAAVPAPLPGAPPYPGAMPVHHPYGPPAYPYHPPHPGYGYPPPGAMPYGYQPPWPPRAGMLPPPGGPGQPPPGYHMHPGMPGHPPPWSQLPPGVPISPGNPTTGAAARPVSAPPQTPLFPVGSGGASTPASLPAVQAGSEGAQQLATSKPEESAPLTDGLVWKETDTSMEERRASLSKYSASPAAKAGGA